MPNASVRPTTIDIENDTLVLVRAEAKRRTGKNPSPATQWRWIRKGCRGVKLEAVQCFGAWYTTATAFSRFIQGMTQAALESSESPAERSEETTAALKAAGVL